MVFYYQNGSDLSHNYYNEVKYYGGHSGLCY